MIAAFSHSASKPWRLLARRSFVSLFVIGLVMWALRDVSFEEILVTLARLHPPAVLALAAVNSGILLLFAIRWRLFLPEAYGSIGLFTLLRYRLAAFGFSYFTPGPQFGGEPLQVYALRNRHGLPTSAAVAAVTLDKLFELLANFTFLVLGSVVSLWVGSSIEIRAGWALLLAVGLLSGPLVYVAFLWKGLHPASWLLAALSSRWPERLSWLAEEAVQIERCMGDFCRRQPRRLLQATALSAFIWAAMLFEYSLMLSAIGVSLNTVQSITALTAARLAFLTPAPGGVGALEAGQAFVFQALGFQPAVGLSLALVIRARDLAFGSLGLWLAGRLASISEPLPLPYQSGD